MWSLETADVHSFSAIEPRFFFSLFHGRARTRDVEALYSALRRHLVVTPGQLGLMTVIGQGSTLGPRGRDLIAKMMADLDPRIDGWSIVIEGTDFWATTARAMTATTRLFSRTRHPFKVSSTTADGLAWLSRQCGRTPRGDVQRLLGAMRSAVQDLARIEPRK